MQIEYCEGCKMKLTDHEFDTGQAVWINNQPYCKSCSGKVAQAKAPASRSGPRATPGSTRPTPGQTGRKLSTPGGSTPRRSGLNRAAPGEPAKASGGHARRSSAHGRAVTTVIPKQGPSMVMVSVVGAAIGVLLAVLVIMIFFR